MSILIVTESYFGNTSTIAESVAEGITEVLGDGQASIITAGETGTALPAGLTAVIVAAPTHDFSLPNPRTREQARGKGAATSTTRGVREWIEALQPVAGLQVVTIDTSTKTPFTSGTASKTAYKLLKKRGFTDARRGPSFHVADIPGPLLDQELLRANQWAQGFARSLSD
ncbi:hypothetical protein EFN05_06390 [Propionibacterium freudenreichii]|uniref:Flavodoxin/nitric oxide synthase n=1 Tax=Propionibacterium freudenreichii TaxID=1744 RepID=A0A2C7AT56_9ACTN|nr:hypothetical protein [Propionibacterium freudenreichii]MCT2974591.1 hypothetical protein [Propionibacterium freudenreichii]MCT2976059.1 hypothetical protein [Propionibacterium freudenreichii]MCT2998775.1 hypothetical protein [Propionibacterium freudenreichii]MCT3001458.1 hypothetical protein [Propionibacterium freudenreichii]MCT3011664.1 hypothetical protein [Propionibacterium freudenreichii]